MVLYWSMLTYISCLRVFLYERKWEGFEKFPIDSEIIYSCIYGCKLRKYCVGTKLAGLVQSQGV